MADLGGQKEKTAPLDDKIQEEKVEISCHVN